jgi:nucleotide-binding universal stress UspA family protein
MISGTDVSAPRSVKVDSLLLERRGYVFSKILVCCDGSAKSLQAAETAAEIARKFGSEVVLLSVYDPSRVPSATMGIPGGPLETVEDVGLYAAETHSAVEHDTGGVFQMAGVPYRTRRELGHPVDRIISSAEDEHADLIVMGSRGIGGFERLLLGSVSEGVLRHAHCPVLSVR